MTVPAAALERLTVEQFARMVGRAEDDLPAGVGDVIARTDLAFRPLEQRERDRVILGLLRQLDARGFSRVGHERRGIWEQAWAERADAFAKASYEVDGLLPNYLDVQPIVRLDRDFVMPREATFERRFSDVFRSWLFREYLGDASAVYEFGCGSGFNLAKLGQEYPDKRLHGLDWAESAVRLVETVGRRHALRLTGHRFDFFAPDPALVLEPNSAVLTMCALEQVGERHAAFVDFLLSRAPDVCVHMEPLVELYDPDNLVDDLAIRYHRLRGYLEGFLPRLRDLEREGRLVIRECRRVFFGNLYHEGYSFVVWTPTA